MHIIIMKIKNTTKIIKTKLKLLSSPLTGFNKLVDTLVDVKPHSQHIVSQQP